MRSPQLFTGPRFWAEEGSLYYSVMQHHHFARAMSLVLNGNYQFLTNLLVALSLLFKARLAAFITTYLAFSIDCYCWVLISRFMAARSCSRMSIVAASGLFALQVSGYEVLLNATNIQWVCSVITLFLFLDRAPATGLATFLRCTLVAAFGTTGVTSCILLPVAGVAAWRSGTRHHRSMLLTLLAATIVQAALVLTQPGNSGRAFSPSGAYLIPLALQGVLSAFVPAVSIDAVGGSLGDAGRSTAALGFQIALLGLAGLAALAAAAAESIGRFEAAILAAAAVFCTLVNEFGAIGTLDDLTSSYGGSRYFFLASTCVMVLLAAGMNSASAWKRRIGALAVTVVASNVVLTAVASPLPRIFFTGEPFAAQIEACGAASACSVYAWPEAEYDRFVVDGSRLRAP